MARAEPQPRCLSPPCGLGGLGGLRGLGGLGGLVIWLAWLPGYLAALARLGRLGHLGRLGGVWRAVTRGLWQLLGSTTKGGTSRELSPPSVASYATWCRGLLSQMPPRNHSPSRISKMRARNHRLPAR